MRDDAGGFGLPFPVESLDEFTGGEVMFEIQLEPRDMASLTVTEIHRRYGLDVATYVIRLRSSIEVWKRIAYARTVHNSGASNE